MKIVSEDTFEMICVISWGKNLWLMSWNLKDSRMLIWFCFHRVPSDLGFMNRLSSGQRTTGLMSQTVVPGFGKWAVSCSSSSIIQRDAFSSPSFQVLSSLLPSFSFSVQHTDSSCTLKRKSDYCNLVHLMNTNATLTLKYLTLNVFWGKVPHSNLLFLTQEVHTSEGNDADTKTIVSTPFIDMEHHTECRRHTTVRTEIYIHLFLRVFVQHNINTIIFSQLYIYNKVK